MIKSVLLTRSKSENSLLKKKLELTGFELIDCSLIEYKLLRLDDSMLQNYSNIIITSNFAANNFPDSKSGIKNIWVVGDKSKKALQDKGHEIKFCAQDAKTLKNELLKAEEESFLYVSGDHITVEMPGFVERVIFYKAFYKQSLLNSEIDRYKRGVDYILLYSSNCAKTLLQLLMENNLLKYMENTTIVAISDKVAKVVENYFNNIECCGSGDKIIKFLEEHR